MEREAWPRNSESPFTNCRSSRPTSSKNIASTNRSICGSGPPPVFSRRSGAKTESRCHRQLGKRFGDQAYAIEELVAELGAAFLCADLRINGEPRADHAQYLASWLAVMKADKKAIFTAAAKASEAAAFLAALQPIQPATQE